VLDISVCLWSCACWLRPKWGIRACVLRCLHEVAGWVRGVYAVFFGMIGYS
jgi:hypothetical protein